MDPPTLFIALPVAQRFACPPCTAQGVLTVRKREGLKKHLNKDHGLGWELSYVCCDTEFSCRQHRYAIKNAKAHFEEAHPEVRFEIEDGDELGLAATSYNELIERIVQLAAPARPAPPPSSSSSSSGPETPSSPLLVRARSAAARARNAQRRRQDTEEQHLTPPRVPIRPAETTGPQDVPRPELTEPAPTEETPGRPAFTARRLPDSPGPPDSPSPPPSPDPPLVPEHPPPELSAWQREWLPRFPPDIAWGRFLQTLEELIAAVSPPQPARRSPGQRRERPRRNQGENTKEATRLQRLYRRAPRRAMREILQDSSPYCSVPARTISAHFQATYAEREGCLGDPILDTMPAAPEPPQLLDPVSPGDVVRVLRRASNTAPGPDGIKYDVWRRRDPSGHVLAAIFNVCVANRRFPPAWKKSTTILIHKKGEVDDMTNWRPIALSDTIGKVFCSVLADRLSEWAKTHEILSGAQKGFTQSEGCLEHNFLLQELLDDARRRGRECCVAWLDLANAFGSVPHSALLAALRTAGLAPDQVDLIADLYEGSSTCIRHSAGTTDAIDFRAGVRQGCPLSPFLFNLVMEYLIRPVVALEEQHGAELHGTSLSVLAYADDLALVARSEASLEALLGAVTSAASWVGLRFKPTKCATLHAANRRILPTIFRIDGQPLRVLSDGESYQHLGVPTGMRVDQTPLATIARLEREAERIFGSLLAPWQKLHALRTFTVPQLDFQLRTARINKTALRGLDAAIKSGCKRTLHLPSRASAEMVYLPPSSGGAGLLPLADLSDLAAVGHAFRLLTSPDVKVAGMALEGLARSAGQRNAAVAGREFLVAYLNGEFAGNSNLATTFSSARAAFNRVSKKLPDLRWGWCGERSTWQLHVPGTRHTTIIDNTSRGALSSCLRASMQHHYRATLAVKPDQGRVARVTTTCPTANHMLHEGRYTRFADWRFLHRARLNVLPLNGCRRWGNGDRRCRRCGRHDETTAHVLCHCYSALASGITRRHNAVLDLLAAAVRPVEGTTLRVNQRVPLDTLLPNSTLPEEMVRCRPDLVTIDEVNKLIRIVDVTLPYEDGWQSIAAARENKISIYTPLAQALRAGGYTTTIDAFVVGSLGAWDNANWGTLARLGVNRRYGTTLSRRCTSAAIRWSRDIYVTHITGVQQWQD